MYIQSCVPFPPILGYLRPNTSGKIRFGLVQLALLFKHFDFSSVLAMVYALVIVKDSRILREAKQASEVGIQQSHEKNHEVLVGIKGLDHSGAR